jgi:hypothetical protein
LAGAARLTATLGPREADAAIVVSGHVFGTAIHMGWEQACPSMRTMDLQRYEILIEKQPKSEFMP